jgi:hypothetical protein
MSLKDQLKMYHRTFKIRLKLTLGNSDHGYLHQFPIKISMGCVTASKLTGEK